MNPVGRLVMSCPKYEEKYEEEDVANNEDSDDEYVAKDKRSKSKVLKDCKQTFVKCGEAQKLDKLIVKELTVVIVMMRMCDSDKLCAGKVWKHSHSAHESLVLGQVPPSNSVSRVCTQPRIPSDEALFRPGSVQKKLTVCSKAVSRCNQSGQG